MLGDLWCTAFFESFLLFYVSPMKSLFDQIVHWQLECMISYLSVFLFPRESAVEQEIREQFPGVSFLFLPSGSHELKSPV